MVHLGLEQHRPVLVAIFLKRKQAISSGGGDAVAEVNSNAAALIVPNIRPPRAT